MNEDKAAYVIVTIQGPFGEIRQVSDRMRVSEAVMTAAKLMGAGHEMGVRGYTLRYLDAEVVQLTQDK